MSRKIVIQTGKNRKKKVLKFKNLSNLHLYDNPEHGL